MAGKKKDDEDPVKATAEPSDPVKRRLARRKELLAENPDIQALVTAAEGLKDYREEVSLGSIFDRVKEANEAKAARFAARKAADKAAGRR